MLIVSLMDIYTLSVKINAIVLSIVILNVVYAEFVKEDRNA
jgi:hypothetical protein